MTPEEALNYRVLARHIPSLSKILTRTHYSVIYTFSPSTSSWEKSGVEGTLFVVGLLPLSGTSSPRYALIILNRRGLDNWILQLKSAEGVQVTDEYIILQGQRRVIDAVDDGADREEEEEEEGKVWGIWVFEEAGSTQGQRQECADWIIRCANWAEGNERKDENGVGEGRRDINAGGWADGVAPAEGITHQREMHSQHAVTSNGSDDNAARRQQPGSSPDLMALLNQGRRRQQSCGPPLASQAPDAGRNALGDLFRRAGENQRN
ncbi:MAG: hypothetical protein Q9217_001916 [Psora testacea]